MQEKTQEGISSSTRIDFTGKMAMRVATLLKEIE